MMDLAPPYAGNPLSIGAPSLSSRRPSSAHPTLSSAKPLVRPQPRSNLITSPTRSQHPHPQSTGRPYSPPQPPSARYPSPPTSTRPHSFSGGPGGPGNRTGSPAGGGGGLHAQSVQKGPSEEELEQFAGLCRALYYDKDAGAAQAVDSVLNRLPAGSRTAYARTMASVRSQFHLDSEIRRRASVESALAAARPGQLIMDALRISEGGTVAMRSPRARKERAERLRGFIRAHCLKGLPGTLPFFKSLYAVLFLQGRKAERGGAGKRRVEWEVDVAVFSEAGGGTWMVDSIECLKSVLGFTERVKETVRVQSYFEEDDGEDTPIASPPFGPSGTPDEGPSEEEEDEPADLHPMHPSPPISRKAKRPPPQVPPHRQPTLRTRASSDPFIDPDRRTPVTNGPLSSPPMPSPNSELGLLDSPSSTPRTPLATPSASPLLNVEPAPPPPQFRIFTVPAYLTDPELVALAKLFPEFVTVGATPPRFPGKVDEENVGAEARLGPSGSGRGAGGGEEARIGHGEIRIGAGARDAGFRGTGWERFVAWLRRLFGGS